MSRGTLDPARLSLFSRTRLSLSLAALSRNVPVTRIILIAVRNPGVHARRFGLFPVRSPLLWKSIFLSFPPGT